MRTWVFTFLAAVIGFLISLAPAPSGATTPCIGQVGEVVGLDLWSVEVDGEPQEFESPDGTLFTEVVDFSGVVHGGLYDPVSGGVRAVTLERIP